MSQATATRERTGPVAPYHDREEWAEEHRKGIGGSEAAAVVGYDEYTSAADVYDRKVGLVDYDVGDPSGDIRRGNKQEPIAADKFTEETGHKIRRQPMRWSPEHDWMLCDIDRQVLNLEEPTLLEIKVPRVGSFFEIQEMGLPKKYLIQLHHNMICWGYERSFFAVYTPEYDELIHFDVRLDEDLAEWLVEQERTFWREYVEERVRPPEPWECENPPELPTYEGEAEHVTSDAWAQAAEDYRVADAKLAWWEAQKEDAKARLVKIATGGDEEAAAKAAGAGVKVNVYWNRGRSRFKKNEFRNAHPEIDLDPFHARGEPYRVTRVRILEAATVPELEDA